MVKRGIGEDQIKKAELSKQKILNFLKDGQWHRYGEILSTIKVSPTTLTKHLKELEKGIVERKVDIKSGEYPPPVCYRIRPKSSELFRALTEQEALDSRSKYITEDGRLENYWREYIAETSINIMHLLSMHFAFKKHGIQNDESFNQELELFFIPNFRDHVQNARLKLKELADKGVDVVKLVGESSEKISKDADYLLKQVHTSKRRHNFKSSNS